MEQISNILKALADKNRLRIIKLLEKKKMCVCELAFILGITQPSTSRHLKKLKSAGLIDDEQDGLWTNYFLKKYDSTYIKSLIAYVHKWSNNDPEVLSDLEKSKKINRSKLCGKKGENNG